ncbi:hypothetical protein [Microlunatus sp. Gsoil 973]|uniref:hypothetical protein n=1 Tax=Microlunatus sp. Gsoil 973 TaxID=2672569 RepID=UPI0012B500E0|nr:hypothetical protein [Microlunatus sp. Gsoil 973]QGN34815.1 hypothetical protein GJV80_20545 [Microlunatus sp. Gsoil 973]
MDFDDYQAMARSAAWDADFQHEIVPLLGVAAQVGSLADAHQAYLREEVGAGPNRSRVGRHLGEVLRWVALVAAHDRLTLNEIAHRNLRKIDLRAKSLGMPGLPDVPDAGESLSLGAYQRLARHTDQQAKDGLDPLALSVPILGLAGEMGSLLVTLKKRYRGDEVSLSWPDFVEEELGDLLWYLAAVATHATLQLEELAEADLELARVARASIEESLDPATSLLVLDSGYPTTERFPRRLLLKFQESRSSGRPAVSMTLVDVDPNAYPCGPVEMANGRSRGFQVGAQLGDVVTDNSSVNDDYRYHDAVHLGFMAVMGWSPNLRSLLRLKRKSDPQVDENEDGARAVFAEEGLAALLAKRAEEASWYANPRLVPDEAVEMMTTVLEDLEVSRMPAWLWRRAISQGFGVFRALAAGHGGYVLADLDQRSLSYSKLPPRKLGDRDVSALL